jgi:hypothetical protein
MSNPKDFEDTDGEQGFQPRPPDNLGREDFRPLGAPIRRPAPAPQRTHVHGDIYRPDGKLETGIKKPGDAT